MIKAASVQFQHIADDKKANFRIIERFCTSAAQQKAQLIVFPEMCITGYWHIRNKKLKEIEVLAESIPDGLSCQRLQDLAQKFQLVVGAGLIEKSREGKIYNSYLVCEPNGKFHVHRKIHCFINEHFDSGDRYTVFNSLLGHKIGILTCYDNNLVENVRITALMGAEILLAPHQTGGVRSRSPFAMGSIDPELWRRRDIDPEAIETEFRGQKGREWLMRWLPSRAHDNGMFLVFSNGVGQDDDEVRTGNAMIIDCYGRIIKETWKAKDDMVVADLDMDLLKHCTGQRWMRGRKPALYHLLAKTTGTELDPRKARFTK